MIAGLFVLSGFFSGSETALFSLSSIHRDRLRREGATSGKRVLRLLEKPSHLIVTLLMGNEFVNVSISAVTASVFANLFPGNRWLPVLVLTVALLFFGEITPKSVAISRPIVFSRMVSAPLLFIYWLITPVRFLVEKLVGTLASFLGGNVLEQRPITEAEFRQLATIGAREGALEEDEAQMIHRVFDLGDTNVDSIMTPRTEIVSLSHSTRLSEVVEQFPVQRFARLPVYDQTIDNVVGILHVNDLLRHKLAGENPTLAHICRPALYVPISMKADDLLALFRAHRIHLAIVIDEYGGTAGLVTLDDVLGQLFGELLAERSDEDFTHHICDNGDLIVAGSMEVKTFGEIVQREFVTDGIETVGGLVFHHFGHLPAQGDVIVIDHLRFTVLKIKENRIWRVRIFMGAGQ